VRIAGKTQFAAWCALLGVPLLAAMLWMASGRETLTKSGKAVEFTVRDELFGDTLVERRLVPGPVLGYYVGLDVVAATALAALVSGFIWRRVTSRSQQREPPREVGTNDSSRA
jgi:hypothetical protein